MLCEGWEAVGGLGKQRVKEHMGSGGEEIAGDGAGGFSIGCFARMLPRRCAVLVLILAGLLALGANAETFAASDDIIVPRNSLEWSVEQSALIVRGTVRPGMLKKMPGSNPPRVEVTLDVTEVIKGGGRVAQVTFSAPPVEGMDAGATWVDLLVFLNHAGTAKANASSAAAEGWAAEDDGVFVLGEKTREARLLDGTTVADGEPLLKAAMAAAKYAKERLEPCDSVDLDGLIVPRDGRLEALGQRLLAGNTQARTKGVNLLRYFNSAENQARLREILERDPAFHVDPAEEWTARLDERWWKEYPVREQALNVLVGWKKTGGVDAELRTPFLRYGPVSWWFWGVWLTVVLVVGILVWRGFGFAGFTTVVLIGVSLLVMVGWWRSVWVTQSFSYAAGGADIEMVSGRGKIALLRVQDDAPRHGWAVRRYGADETGGGLWFAHYLSPREDRGSGSFRWAEGVTAGNGYWFSLLQLPYWVVVAVLLAWPLARGIARVGRGMRKRRRVRGAIRVGLFVAAFLAGTCAHNARALVIAPITKCIELRVTTPVVVRGTFRVRADGILWTESHGQFEFNVLETIKGKASERLRVHVPKISNFDLRTEFALHASQSEWLLCLDLIGPKGEENPTDFASFGPAIALDGTEKRAFQMDGTQLSEPRKLLELSRIAALRTQSSPYTWLASDWFPDDSSFHQVPYGKLEVPQDDRLEKVLVEWADHPMLAYRVVAARMLQFYRSPENAGRLRRLLKDPGYYVERAQYWEPVADRRVTRFYEARELAAKSLATWKIDVAPKVRTPGFPYRPPPWARWLIMLAVGVILIGLDSRRGGTPLFRRMIIGLSIFLLPPASWLTWRSDKTCDSLGWSSRGVSCELASAGGGISSLRVEDGSLSRGVGLRNDVMGKRPGATWFSPLLNSAGSKEKAGFVGEWGVVWGADPSKTAYTYRLTRVPFWAVIGVLCVAPVLALLGMAQRSMRRRRYLRSGRCVACGYDMRGSDGRCPECGAGTIRVATLPIC